jgi:eukaryotic-like serine/threonine-protein kinase
MESPQLIGPLARTTPAGDVARRRRVPADLVREASQRLGVLALIGTALWTIAPSVAHLRSGDLARFHPGDAIGLGCVLVSLGLFLYSRGPRRDPHFVLDLGLAYLVFVALALALLNHLAHAPPDPREAPGISWIGAVMLMFPAIAPTTPRRTFVACAIAAAMSPISLILARDVSPARALIFHYPDFVLVGVSVVIAHVVRRLGQQVGRAREMGSYQLGELLGRGGMGEVHRATHRMLARPAAIKLIRPEMLGSLQGESAEMVLKRFRREAEVAASLRSPHTVELYDFGITEDQTLYFVMELLDGMDLEELVTTKGPLPAARVLHILRQVCESLEEAHARELVHRDIKPANIHLGRLGLRHDFVKVLDFGLVKSVGGDGRDSSLDTAVGMTPGTPAYMAPEIALGGEVDGRADLYALGCVAYFLLTGLLVFEADSAIQIVARHLHDAPEPPSKRTELPIPPALDALVLRCLAKSPADRPPTAAAVAAELAPIDVEPWTEEQARRWWQLNQPG